MKLRLNSKTAISLLAARDGGRHCSACRSTNRLTVDHVRPLSVGGADAIENMRILCYDCHTSVNDRFHAANKAYFTQDNGGSRKWCWCSHNRSQHTRYATGKLCLMPGCRCIHYQFNETDERNKSIAPGGRLKLIWYPDLARPLRRREPVAGP